MDRNTKKEAGRRKLIWDKASALKKQPARKGPTKEFIKQAGRRRAIEAAKKHLTAAQQTAAQEQEQQPYSAVDTVECVAAYGADELVQYAGQPHSKQPENVFHREKSFQASTQRRTSKSAERMRHQARKVKSDAGKHGTRNEFHRETHSAERSAIRAATPKEQMRRQLIEKIKRQKADEATERSKNLFHGETSFDEGQTDLAPIPKELTLEETHRERAEDLRGHSENMFHSETYYEAESVPPARRSRPHTSSNTGKTAQSNKKAKGQRQTVLPRYSSSVSRNELAKKQGRRLAQTEAARQVKTGGRVYGYSVLHRFGAAVKRAVRPNNSELLLYGGFAVVLLIPLIMLAGIAVALFGSGGGRSGYVPVSAEVEAYRTLIRLYASQHGIPEYEDLIAAVMMQESGGQGDDPMQCSECGLNTRYPRTPNGITDPEYSIDIGIQNLADCLRLAVTDSPIDLDHISLALQGYNYGSGYIGWALARYGGYTELNVIEFSEMMATQSGSAGYGDRAYVSHVLRYYPLGRSFMDAGNSAIVAVAQSQLGNEGGLKYCEWYGYPYRVEWCAIFVSWCAEQCGYLDAGILPKELNVIPYVEWFRERGQWQYRDYEPRPGDIIFLDWTSDGLSDHVGIVEKAEDGFVYTIEGNANDRCAESRYYLNAAPVCGYGVPGY